jgi:hypothetical protein
VAQRLPAFDRLEAAVHTDARLEAGREMEVRAAVALQVAEEIVESRHRPTP